MKHLLIGATVAAALPSLALASCPTAADFAAHGVSAVYEDGARSTFSRGPDGRVTERIVISEVFDYVDVITYAGGLYIVGAEVEADGAAVPEEARTYNYSVPGASLPGFVPGLTTELSLIETRNGAPDVPVKMRVTIGEAEEIAIGGCTYAALRGEVEERREGETMRERFMHLTDLGFSVVTGHTHADGSSGDYMPVSLTAVEPELCVAADDLATRGVAITRRHFGVSTMTLRAGAEGVLTFEVRNADGSEVSEAGALIGGVLPVMLTGGGDSADRVELRYALETSGFAFAPGVAIESAFDSEEIRSGERRSETGKVMVAVGAARQAKIGACEYRVANMTILTDGGRRMSDTRQALWFVDLGFGVPVEGEYGEEIRKFAPAQG